MTSTRALGLGVVLLAFWLVLSGHWEPRLIGFGVVSCALVVWLATRMGVVDAEAQPFHLAGRFLVYLPWLLKETYVANFNVAKIILNPRLPIRPALVHYSASQATDLGKVLYANSITLTPGTITTDVKGADFEIHCLTWVDVDWEEEQEMDRRVRWVEQGGAG